MFETLALTKSQVTFLFSSDTANCVNAIQGPQDFTFPNLTILKIYDLRMDSRSFKKDIKLQNFGKKRIPYYINNMFVK